MRSMAKTPTEVGDSPLQLQCPRVRIRLLMAHCVPKKSRTHSGSMTDRSWLRDMKETSE